MRELPIGAVWGFVLGGRVRCRPCPPGAVPAAAAPRAPELSGAPVPPRHPSAGGSQACRGCGTDSGLEGASPPPHPLPPSTADSCDRAADVCTYSGGAGPADPRGGGVADGSCKGFGRKGEGGVTGGWTRRLAPGGRRRPAAPVAAATAAAVWPRRCRLATARQRAASPLRHPVVGGVSPPPSNRPPCPPTPDRQRRPYRPSRAGRRRHWAREHHLLFETPVTLVLIWTATFFIASVPPWRTSPTPPAARLEKRGRMTAPRVAATHSHPAMEVSPLTRLLLSPAALAAAWRCAPRPRDPSRRLLRRCLPRWPPHPQPTSLSLCRTGQLKGGEII